MLRAATIVVMCFLHAPIVVIVLASFAPEAYLTLPTSGLSLRWYRSLSNHPEFISAFWLSVKLGLAAAFLATVVAVPAAVALVRYQFPGRRVIATACLSPLIVPVVVTGLALLNFFNPLGLYGTFVGLLAAHAALTSPYAIKTVSAGLIGVPRALELAAQDLGAKPLRTFLTVTLPLIRTSIVAGALMAFLMSFDTFTVTFFLAGARQRTLPLEIYQYLVLFVDPVICAASALLIGVSTVTALLLERMLGLRRLLAGAD